MAGDFTEFVTGLAAGAKGDPFPVGGGGRFLVEVSGTFNASTIKVQLRRAATVSPPVAAGPWLSLGTLGDFTEDEAREVAIGPGMEIRAIDDSGLATSVNAFYAIIDHRNKK